MERVVGFWGFFQASQHCVSHPCARSRDWGEIQALIQSLVSRLVQSAASKSGLNRRAHSLPPQGAEQLSQESHPIQNQSKWEQFFSLGWATHPGAITPEVDQIPAGSTFPCTALWIPSHPLCRGWGWGEDK